MDSNLPYCVMKFTKNRLSLFMPITMFLLMSELPVDSILRSSSIYIYII